MDRKGKTVTAEADPPDSPHYRPEHGSDAIITLENVVIKGYHHFQRRPLQGMQMDIVREYDNPYDKDAYLVRMPHLANIPAHKHDIVTDARRGTTVKSIAGKPIGRMPAGLCKILAEMDRDGILSGPTCAATGEPTAPSNKGGGAVIPCDVFIDIDARDKDVIMADLREAVDRHMTAVKHVINIRG